MFIRCKIRFSILSLFSLAFYAVSAQVILPPVIPWSGKSETLIAGVTNPWITSCEKSGFVTTPDYTETISWLKKLSEASPLISMISIGKSAEGRDIIMIIASSEKIVTATALKNSGKPLVFVQAGIHSGEIDGKDAGMMLLRDIAFGNKQQLLDGVNLLFVPILNVDGHERSSPYSRPNQRGPQNQGWRTNSQNLNLNRDYAKLDTKEIRSVLQVINDYDPLLYMDIHVTDGADYQCDITFGGLDGLGYSHAISNWLEKIFKPYVDKDLTANGHIPGPLLNALNDRDFSQGNVMVLGEPRYSNAYGDLRHMAAILVENHSLKPYKQRVLGTYVLLESTLKAMASKGPLLRESTQSDRAKREAKIPLVWKVPQMKKVINFDAHASLENPDDPAAQPPDSIMLQGIESRTLHSKITHADYVEWTGKPITTTIANYKATEEVNYVSRPAAYYVPASSYEIIERLKLHGIQMEILHQAREVTVEMYRIHDARFQNASGIAMPFEGHMQVTGTPVNEIRKQLFAEGSARISTDQPLGDLAMMLLEPKSPDSFLSWGFFDQIFQRTEYMEAYVMEPTIIKMLDESPELKKEFEQKSAQDSRFANDPDAIFSWFYSKTKYFDDQYLLYPVGREL